jgi:hypothetical protein
MRAVRQRLNSKLGGFTVWLLLQVAADAEFLLIRPGPESRGQVEL